MFTDQYVRVDNNVIIELLYLQAIFIISNAKSNFNIKNIIFKKYKLLKSTHRGIK